MVGTQLVYSDYQLVLMVPLETLHLTEVAAAAVDTALAATDLLRTTLQDRLLVPTREAAAAVVTLMPMGEMVVLVFLLFII
jgi:hypothetical protein